MNSPKEITFLVQGSAEKPYETIFRKNGTNLTALCTCPAGQNGLYCKHRFGILEGSPKKIVSDNISDVKIVQEWAIGTDVEAALNDVRVAEKQYEQAQKNLKNMKKKLARAMRD